MTELIVLQSAGLRVEFIRQHDRFAHRVLADDGGPFVTLLESLEGAPDDDWPASPPWQEVLCERRAGGVQLALAVGKAGSNHWSASFELAASGSLVVDVACRAAGIPEQLGGTYGLLVPAALESSPARALLAQRWALQPLGGATVRLFDACRGSPASLSLGPMFDPAGDWPRTVRWRYSVHLLADA